MVQRAGSVGVQICEPEQDAQRQRDDRAWPFELRVILTISVLLLFGAVSSAVLATPQWSFNGTRLVPSFLLASGHKVMELHGEGPLYSTHYGPLTYITYLPATLFKT